MARKKEYKIGGAKAQQLPSGTWRVRLSLGMGDDGKYHTKTFTAPTPQELISIVTEWQARKNVQSCGITFGSAMKEYIRTCQIAGHSPSTIVGYEKIMRNGIKILKDIPIAKIKLTDIQRQINSRSNLSPKTIANEYGLIHKVMSVYAPDMSLSGIILPTNRNKVNADAGIDIPTDGQIITLLKEAKEKDPILYRAILIASQSGLRRSQICALTWADLDGRSLSISKATVKAKDKSFQLKAPKTSRSTRIVTIPQSLSAVLQSVRGQPGDLIVPYSPDAVTRRFERMTARLGIPGRFHDLRHYHCSVMVSLGAPREYIMSDMGHSTDTMYQRVYTHLFPKRKQELYESLSQHADNIINIK